MAWSCLLSNLTYIPKSLVVLPDLGNVKIVTEVLKTPTCFPIFSYMRRQSLGKTTSNRILKFPLLHMMFLAQLYFVHFTVFVLMRQVVTPDKIVTFLTDWRIYTPIRCCWRPAGGVLYSHVLLPQLKRYDT